MGVKRRVNQTQLAVTELHIIFFCTSILQGIKKLQLAQRVGVSASELVRDYALHDATIIINKLLFFLVRPKRPLPLLFIGLMWLLLWCMM